MGVTTKDGVRYPRALTLGLGADSARYGASAEGGAGVGIGLTRGAIEIYYSHGMTGGLQSGASADVELGLWWVDPSQLQGVAWQLHVEVKGKEMSIKGTRSLAVDVAKLVGQKALAALPKFGFDLTAVFELPCFQDGGKLFVDKNADVVFLGFILSAGKGKNVGASAGSSVTLASSWWEES